jgi:hypothetical protein
MKSSLAVVVLVIGARTASAQGAVGGVYIDPQGMLRESSSLSQADLRLKLKLDDAESDVPRNIAAASPLRKISLRRLEETVADAHRLGKPLTAEIHFLAGVSAVKYVFIYPEMRDVVLAGPAEGWEILPSGDAVGRTSRRPVLQLDDLIVALRSSFVDDPFGSFLGCSIEPTEQGVKAHAAFLRKLSSIDQSQIPQIVRGMEQAMGPQEILVYGVAGSTRFALQMVAADYRLKRIALAHDPSPSRKVPSYLDLAEAAVTGGPQKQHRWWFVGHFDAIRHSADRLAFEFEGPGLRVDTAPTQQKNAPHNAAVKPARAATAFAELATKHFEELADQIPAFAELQNLVGLAVAGVLVRKQSEPHKELDVKSAAGDDLPPGAENDSRWRPTHFLDAGHCPVASYEVPKKTPALANVRFVKDRFWMFSVSGGVEINPEAIAAPENVKPATGEKLSQARDAGTAPVNGGSWWWD